MQIFLFLYTKGCVYPYRYLGVHTDSYGVEFVRTQKYSVSAEEVIEQDVLYKNIRETFLVATEDLDSTLKTKYLWKKGH